MKRTPLNQIHGGTSVKEKTEIKAVRNHSFWDSLIQARLVMGVLNAILIGLALGLTGTKRDYFFGGSYLLVNLMILLIPVLKKIAIHWFRIPLLLLDLIVTGYFIYRTGGVSSNLASFLFIPVLVATIRYRYLGTLIWASLMATVLVITTFLSGSMVLMPLVIMISYLYLAGILGSYLIHRTYTVSEEISHRLERWNTELQRLNNFSLEVVGSSDLGQILSRTFQIVSQSNISQMVAIMIFDEDETLRIYDSTGWEENWQQLYAQNPLSKHSFSLAPILVFKKPLICPDIRRHNELVKTFNGIPVAALYAFPLILNNEVIGALVVTNPQPRRLNEQELEILAGITNQTGIALQNIDSLSKEKLKADTDGLTGLYNRRYFNEQIEELFYRAQETENPLSLILLDVDNFKKYNDTFGHPEGDQLLKKVASEIVTAVRDHDIVARYGGEEFAVILKDTDSQLALQIAERIRSAVEKISRGILKTEVTISAGVGTMPDQAKDWGSLLEFADQSLYQAKHDGKNRVCSGYSA